ncbi:MAG: hypothetical protein JSU93_08115 [Methanobacteriota archaeon]|nr:MAG: hypothetical protein JSU93_08115 [Euryarchaeota archaeon]
MALGIRRQSAQENSPPQEERGVPYRLASYEHDNEGKRFKSSEVVYSFWSAAKYTLVLSIILWWLPLFGQMIAGYVGGRRAGGPWKGVAASILPVVCLYVVVTGFDSGFFPSHVMGVAIAPAAVAASLGESIPLISPYIQFSSEYVGSFVDALAGSSPYGINTYIVTVAFAYVGGILAEQSRREIEYTSGAVMHNTTVLMADNQQRQPQGLHPYPAPARPGLAHMIASHMPWAHLHHGDHSHQHVYALPPARADGWECAAAGSIDSRSGQAREEAPEIIGPNRKRSSRKGPDSRQARRKGQKGRHRASKDPWQRAERRVRQPYSSAKRFASGYETTNSTAKRRRRSKTPKGAERSRERFAPESTRSVKRTRRKIDREWSDHHRTDHAPLRSMEFYDDEDGITEGAAERARSSSRHSAPRSKRWDTI